MQTLTCKNCGNPIVFTGRQSWEHISGGLHTPLTLNRECPGEHSVFTRTWAWPVFIGPLTQYGGE